MTSKKARNWLVQIGLSILLLGAIVYFVHNVSINLNRLGLVSGFGFLFDRAGYDLDSPILRYTADSTYLDAYFVGLVNTIIVSLCGILLATVLGFTLGILRLSGNWLASKTVYVVVEFSRNIPLVIWVIVWYFGVFLQLPSPKNALDILDIIFLSNRGVYVPQPEFSLVSLSIFIIALGVGVLIKILYSRYAEKIQNSTGRQLPTFTVGVASIVGIPTVVYLLFLQRSIVWSVPLFQRFNFSGGMALKPEFIALLMGLSVYTACNIAEIVRSGINSVAKGQREAAKSLNLTPWQVMRMIIIPQALRVIIPPLNSQYLNLTKNSSLAIVVGYTDVVSTLGGTTLNQTGQALECITMVMATYLVLSLLISAVMNGINRKVQIVTK